VRRRGGFGHVSGLELTQVSGLELTQERIINLKCLRKSIFLKNNTKRKDIKQK